MRRHYWWPGMTVFIKNYIAGCGACQQMKVNTHPSAPGLIPIKAQQNATPFSQVTCNFITDLPESDGFDSNNQRCPNRTKLHRPCLPTIWAPQFLPIRQGTTILITSLLRNDQIVRNQNPTKHRLPPSNWQRNRTSEPRTWNLFPNLLFE